MPVYANILNNLLRMLPEGTATERYRTALRLSPQSESFSDQSLSQSVQTEHLYGWHTRLAVESLRGWKWPYWINAQLNPAIIPFTDTSIQPLLTNQSNRDAALIPGIDSKFTGTMDRRGMVTPVGSQFSLETWFRIGDRLVFPSELIDQSDFKFDSNSKCTTVQISIPEAILTIRVSANQLDTFDYLRIKASVRPKSSVPVGIYFSIRPYNLESVTSIRDLVYNSKGFWMSHNRILAWCASRPDISWASDAQHGDSALFLNAPPDRTAIRCPAGMATSVSGFHFTETDADTSESEIIIPLNPAFPREFPFPQLIVGKSNSNLLDKSKATSNDEATGVLAESITQLKTMSDVKSDEVQAMFLHNPSSVTSMVRALILINERTLAARILNYLSFGFQKNGYLPAGRGSWAFQGQYLTALADYYRLSGNSADETILRYSQIKTAAFWIIRKRDEISNSPNKPKGLLPPGATRNGDAVEYQLTDNFWALEGLEAARDLARLFGAPTDADVFHADAIKYASQINAAIHRELEYGISQQVPGRLHRAFDAASAADLLDISLTAEAQPLLKPSDWLEKLLGSLGEPMAGVEMVNGVRFLSMDSRGIKVDRRILLHLAHYQVYGKWLDDYQDLGRLTTPQNSWTEALNLHNRSGTGRIMHSAQAAALYILLMHQADKLEVSANNRGF